MSSKREQSHKSEEEILNIDMKVNMTDRNFCKFKNSLG